MTRYINREMIYFDDFIVVYDRIKISRANFLANALYVIQVGKIL